MVVEDDWWGVGDLCHVNWIWVNKWVMCTSQKSTFSLHLDNVLLHESARCTVLWPKHRVGVVVWDKESYFICLLFFDKVWVEFKSCCGISFSLTEWSRQRVGYWLSTVPFTIHACEPPQNRPFSAPNCFPLTNCAGDDAAATRPCHVLSNCSIAARLATCALARSRCPSQLSSLPLS